MFVCVCHGVTDRDIRQAADAGCGSVTELTMRTGCGSSCGSCLTMAADMLDTARGTASGACIDLPMIARAA